MLENLNPDAKDWITALLILAAFWIPAAVLRFLWGRILSPWIKRSNDPNSVFLLKPLGSLVMWGLILGGLNFSLQALDYVANREVLLAGVPRALTIAWVILAMATASRLVTGLFQYHAHKSAASQEEVRDRVSTSQKLATGAIIVVGLLFIMRIAGVDISPLLAGGAVGGIIIGLALQDSLSNVFAGLFLNMDRPIRVGELLRLDQDREGFVEEVGWRYTKVRLMNDSLLVIPNNKFGQSTFINFHRPIASLTVNVECSVSYDSDLEQVEKVAIEAARAAQEHIADRDLHFDPYVRWRSFGDFAIVFRVFFRVDNPTKQYRATSECIKQIHRRFREADIVIPFPVRDVRVMRDAEHAQDF